MGNSRCKTTIPTATRVPTTVEKSPRGWNMLDVMSIMEYQVITTSTPSIAMLVLTNQSSAIDDAHTVYKRLYL